MLLGKSKEHIINVVEKLTLFSDVNNQILRWLREKEEISGAALKEYYEGKILWMLNYARERAMNSLCSDHPFDWMYNTDLSRLISKEAGLLRKEHLEEDVALVIELDDKSGLEHFGWGATGIHYLEITQTFDEEKNDVIFVIGINGH